MGSILFRSRLLYSVSGRIVHVISGECDGRIHVLHNKTAVTDVLHYTALAPLRLDADAIFGVLERAVPHRHVAHASCRLTADRYSVPVEKCTIRHCNILSSELPAFHLPPGLDGDVVVTNVNPALGNKHMPTRAGIDGVRICRTLRGRNGHIR